MVQKLLAMPIMEYAPRYKGPKEEIAASMSNVDGQIEVITLDSELIQEWLVDQLNILYGLNLEPDFILMGSDEFEQVFRTLYTQRPMNFILEVAIYRDTGRERKTLRGIPVRVSPTISGMCVVPKER
jgi:hypothetical protein